MTTNFVITNNQEFVLPAPRIEFFKKQPIYTLPHEWNSLGDIRFQNNMVTFRIALKKDLLNILDEVEE